LYEGIESYKICGEFQPAAKATRQSFTNRILRACELRILSRSWIPTLKLMKFYTYLPKMKIFRCMSRWIRTFWLWLCCC
jgi:hypothetical protein